MEPKSYTIKLNPKEAHSVFDKLTQSYRVVAPVKRDGKGRFSDTALVTYDEVKNIEQIVFDKQTYFSAKSEVFPIRETLFTIQEGVLKEQRLDVKPAIIFLRSCDIHAMQVMDIHFLKDSGKQDCYYKERREKIKFFLIECSQSFENCYCVSMGTNKTDDYSVFMRRTEEGYEAEVKDVDLRGFFHQRVDSIECPRFVEYNRRSVNIPEHIPNQIFEDDLWKEYSQRCIACGRCNTSCPTCACFTVQEVSTGDPGVMERRRIWSSCHVNKFALIAGGHDFRVEFGDRMRYKTLHKIRDFRVRAGRQMCIGCGRCDDVCPEYISMFKCVDKINQIIKDTENNG